MKVALLILVLLCNDQLLAGDLKSTRPHPSLSPKDVVHIVMNALKNNDHPNKNSGIAITFKFASPANKINTGPLERFSSIIKSQTFQSMINHHSTTYEKYNLLGNRANIDVILISSVGKIFGYRFFLSRQNGNKFEGCWMTDAVIPIRVITL
ncbi:MAG: hypothetical protein VX693_02530 [Pseudomonadota bacterium]|nr:hypothetical protein [Pseudomonadota bacterium]